MNIILILHIEDKETADSPCKEIRISGKLKTRPKRTKRSVPKNAKRSVPETFRSVLEAFRFVQTVHRSRGVVVRFRVCTFRFLIDVTTVCFLSRTVVITPLNTSSNQ